MSANSERLAVPLVLCRTDAFVFGFEARHLCSRLGRIVPGSLPSLEARLGLPAADGPMPCEGLALRSGERLSVGAVLSFVPWPTGALRPVPAVLAGSTRLCGLAAFALDEGAPGHAPVLLFDLDALPPAP